MRQVKLTIETAHDAVPAMAEVRHEILRNEKWELERRWILDAGATRTILILDHERLVIGDAKKEVVVYDKEHNVARIEEKIDDVASGQ
jgi:hypothetical protein